MDDSAKTNGAILCTCLACVTLAYAAEQFADRPLDITSPEAHYAAGTISTQHVHVYAPPPPNGRIDPSAAFREVRWTR
jgi:hypothetical protein